MALVRRSEIHWAQHIFWKSFFKWGCGVFQSLNVVHEWVFFHWLLFWLKCKAVFLIPWYFSKYWVHSWRNMHHELIREWKQGYFPSCELSQQTQNLKNPNTLLIYHASKGRRESFDLKSGQSWGLPQTCLMMLKAHSDPLSASCAGDSTKGSCSSPAGLQRPQGCVSLVWEQIRETTASSSSCPTSSSSQICYIRCTGVLVSYYVTQQGKIFTFGSSRRKPRSLLVKLCLETLNHTQLCGLTIAQLHIIQLQRWVSLL